MTELELLQTLSGSEYRVYSYILYYRTKTGRGSYTPDVTNIMDKLGLSRAQSFNILRSLREKGVIDESL